MRHFGELNDYIRRHETLLGHKPSAIKLSESDFVAVSKSMGIWGEDNKFGAGKLAMLDHQIPAAIINEVPVFVLWDERI